MPKTASSTLPSDTEDIQYGSVGIQTRLSKREEEIARHLVTFTLPENPSDKEIMLGKDFVRLDHKSLRTLGPDSDERSEVRDLLINVVVFLQNRQPIAAAGLLKDAEEVYYQHIQAKNRLRYLAGMLAGVGIMLLFGAGLTLAAGVGPKLMDRSLVPFLMLFAGMGAITSVLTRLPSIDLRDQTSVWMVYISGATRPVTGVFLGLAMYFVVDLKIVDLRLGPANQPPPPGLFVIVAFLSGFSERFAYDILARVGGNSLTRKRPEGRSSSRSSDDGAGGDVVE